MIANEPPAEDSALDQDRQSTVPPRESGENSQNLSTYYDQFMYDELIDKFYGYSDFHNFGIWRPDTKRADDACRTLVKEMVALAPSQPARVLEVGCGKGATTRELRAHWPSSEISGIDISEVQIETCRRNCPDASFTLMDAATMTFAESSFDLLISIEAAFHFRSRRAFLDQARRVLVPGGRLLLQDVLYYKEDGRRWSVSDSSNNLLESTALLPEENYLTGPAEYAALLAEVGFEQTRIIDVTLEGPRRFYEHFQAYMANSQNWIGYDPDHVRRLRIGARLFARKLHYCLLISTEAPG